MPLPTRERRPEGIGNIAFTEAPLSHPRTLCGKRVGNVLDLGFGIPSRGPGDGDDVEASGVIAQAIALEERGSRPSDPSLFVDSHRFPRFAELRGGARLDLDEHDCSLVFGDQVDFSQPHPGRANKDPVARSAQRAGGEPFASIAQSQRRSWEANKATKPILSKVHSTSADSLQPTRRWLPSHRGF